MDVSWTAAQFGARFDVASAAEMTKVLKLFQEMDLTDKQYSLIR